jgi:hypothetical protein
VIDSLSESITLLAFSPPTLGNLVPADCELGPAPCCRVGAPPYERARCRGAVTVAAPASSRAGFRQPAVTTTATWRRTRSWAVRPARPPPSRNGPMISEPVAVCHRRYLIWKPSAKRGAMTCWRSRCVFYDKRQEAQVQLCTSAAPHLNTNDPHRPVNDGAKASVVDLEMMVVSGSKKKVIVLLLPSTDVPMVRQHGGKQRTLCC